MKGASAWLIAPYAAWMALMALLPSTAWAYAVRTAVVAVVLAASIVRIRRLDSGGRIGDATAKTSAGASAMRPYQCTLVGRHLRCRRLSRNLRGSATIPIVRLVGYSIVGLLVFLVWILPEQFDWGWYREWCIVGEGGTRAIAEAGAAMVAVRLAGSAFVISVAEEMFFRRWLVGFAGPWWSVALFALEHDRWLVGAAAGAAYWLLCRRRGLLAAAVAHATTNLALGVWVLRTGQWHFW